MNDSQARLLALDINHSWIVQAPAGSGKTSLLTQRFLRLLANVKQYPEEILAITFTRKAAQEMRHRVIQALKKAPDHITSENSYEQFTCELAQQAYLRNVQEQWNLLEQPQRLRIMTIDSLCSLLAQQMPISSHLGGARNIAAHPESLYKLASEATLRELETSGIHQNHLKQVLLHLDNDHPRAIKLFSDMLASREQWLIYLITPNLRQQLESNLAHIHEDTLIHFQQYSAFIENKLKPYLKELIPFAQNELKRIHSEHSLFDIPNGDNFLNYASCSDLTYWAILSSWLLTQSGEVRKRFTVQDGMPPLSKATSSEKAYYSYMRSQLDQLLCELSDTPEFVELLFSLQYLPPVKYSDEQWQLIESQLHVLLLLVTKLQELFCKHQCVDFIEMSLKALEALGQADSPSDLALKLDYSLQHILIDEFQDTSILQFELLQRLIAGWEGQSGKTLFLVGDPMQSIYRFRKAEVGLFLRIRRYGLSGIPINPLTLQSNFRSEKVIIDWINQLFLHISPQKEDLNTGAITYTPSFAEKQNLDAYVDWHPTYDAIQTEQAETIAKALTTLIQDNPQQSIAILVQSRSHVYELISVLQKAQLPFRAIEIEKLFEQSHIQDLVALTRAVWHPGDRLAWLAILRAPWCALSLQDLLEISLASYNTTLWPALLTQRFENLSASGQESLEKFLPIMQWAMRWRLRIPTSQLIYKLWLKLRGPALLSDIHEIEHINAFMDLLNQLENDGYQGDLSELIKRLMDLTISNQSQLENCIEIMTIHKAKGLEFDVVILPYLDRQQRADNHPFILWHERLSERYGPELLLAPIKRYHHDLLYDFLREQEITKAHHESIRLLYVAMTRAKKKLILHANFQRDKKPSEKSLLGKIWQATASMWPKCEEKTISEPSKINEQSLSQAMSRRKIISPALELIDTEQQTTSTYNIKFNWQSPKERLTGSLLHFFLEHDLIHFDQAKASWLRNYFLLQGFNPDEINWAIEKLTRAVSQMKADSIGQWLLKKHPHSASELALATQVGSLVQHLKIDRTFVAEGFYWIIDFKTSQPALNCSLENFLKQEREHYSVQLITYAKAIEKMVSYPIKLGLYYPLIPFLDAWEYSDALSI